MALYKLARADNAWLQSERTRCILRCLHECLARKAPESQSGYVAMWPRGYVATLLLSHVATWPRGYVANGDQSECLARKACQACMNADPLTLDNIAAGMDEAYQFGGFCYPFGGTVDDHDGTYQSEHDDDPALAPLARFIFDARSRVGFECFVYEYGLTAI